MNIQVNKAIKKATGYDVRLHKAEGCIIFYSDDSKTQDMISSWYDGTVYVNSMNQLTVEQWVKEFKWRISNG